MVLTFFLITLFSIERLDIVEIGNLEDKGYYSDIKVDGKHGYVVAGKEGVVILDLSNPAFPKKIGVIESMDYTYSLDKKGLTLFIADGRAGVRIFDISDMKNFSQSSFIPTKYSSLDIEVDGQYIYVAEGEGGLRIIDISQLEFPTEIARFNSKINVRSLDIADGNAYLANSEGIIILDIRNVDSLKNPTFIKTIDSVYKVISDGRWLFASGGSKDFIVSNIAFPQYPLTQKIQGNFTGIEDIFISGFHLYLAKGESGVSILNLLSPLNPEVVNHTLLIPEAKGIVVSGNLLFVTAGYDGLKVYTIIEE